MTVLDELRIVWPTRSRTGSQFTVQLTTAVMGFASLAPQARINGARKDSYRPEEKSGDFRSMFHEGRGYDYLSDNGIRSMKFEDPGKDDFVLGLLEHAPRALFVASYRPIEMVIESHFNIAKWGHGEDDVLYQFSACLSLYQRLAAAGRLFLLNVHDKSQFDPAAFLRFLGKESMPSKPAQLIEEWAPTNDLAYQVEKWGDVYQGRRRPPRLDRLREIHPWVNDVEQGYLDLIRSTNELGSR